MATRTCIRAFSSSVLSPFLPPVNWPLPFTSASVHLAFLLISRAVSPVCRSGQKNTYGVARNEVISVTCDVDADPPSVTFKWHINNSDISSELKSFTSNYTRSVASYTASTGSRSYGKLICWSENAIGRQREPCIYSILPASEYLVHPLHQNLLLLLLLLSQYLCITIFLPVYSPPSPTSVIGNRLLSLSLCVCALSHLYCLFLFVSLLACLFSSLYCLSCLLFIVNREISPPPRLCIPGPCESVPLSSKERERGRESEKGEMHSCTVS